MNSTYLEKKAMARMLMTLAIQDGEIDINEISVVKEALNVDVDLLKSSSQIDIMDAINTIKSMDKNRKLKFATIVLKVAQADGYFHPAEKDLINQYFNLTGISELLGAS